MTRCGDYAARPSCPGCLVFTGACVSICEYSEVIVGTRGSRLSLSQVKDFFRDGQKPVSQLRFAECSSESGRSFFDKRCREPVGCCWGTEINAADSNRRRVHSDGKTCSYCKAVTSAALYFVITGVPALRTQRRPSGAEERCLEKKKKHSSDSLQRTPVSVMPVAVAQLKVRGALFFCTDRERLARQTH